MSSWGCFFYDLDICLISAGGDLKWATLMDIEASIEGKIQRPGPVTRSRRKKQRLGCGKL